MTAATSRVAVTKWRIRVSQESGVRFTPSVARPTMMRKVIAPCAFAAGLFWPMQGAELVAVRVAYIRQVQRAQLAFTQARRLFDGNSAIRDRSVVELAHLFRRVALEANRGAIAKSRRLAIDRLTDAKRGPVVTIEKSRLPSVVLVPHRLPGSEDTEQGVVELLRTLDVVRSNHDVTEHSYTLRRSRG